MFVPNRFAGVRQFRLEIAAIHVFQGSVQQWRAGSLNFREMADLLFVSIGDQTWNQGDNDFTAVFDALASLEQAADKRQISGAGDFALLI